MEADFAVGKGNDQSGDVENEVFVFFFFFLLDLRVVERLKVRSRAVIAEKRTRINYFFSVD